MRLSQSVREYELAHGLLLDGTLVHGNEKTSFKYGFKTINKNKTTLVHGFLGAQTVTELETVRPINVVIGDKIILADGKQGKVSNTRQELLIQEQLRFVPYEKADKRTLITIEFI